MAFNLVDNGVIVLFNRAMDDMESELERRKVDGEDISVYVIEQV